MVRNLCLHPWVQYLPYATGLRTSFLFPDSGLRSGLWNLPGLSRSPKATEVNLCTGHSSSILVTPVLEPQEAPLAWIMLLMPSLRIWRLFLFLASLVVFCSFMLRELLLFLAFFLMPISWVNYKLLCSAMFFRHFVYQTGHSPRTCCWAILSGQEV